MKKWTLILLAVTAMTPIQAQELIAPVPGRREVERMPPPPPPRTEIRISDVLQMVNPFAPREYGSGPGLTYSQEETSDSMGPNRYEDRTHQQVKAHGFRLFSIAFW